MPALIKCRIESPLHAEYAWVMSVMGRHFGFDVRLVEADEDILIAEHGMGDIQVSHFFRQIYQSGDMHFKAYFRKEPLHLTASGKPDLLSSCFYILAQLQEYTDYIPDTYDRFPYQQSWQYHFSCLQRNLVSEYFEQLFEMTPRLRDRVQPVEHRTSVFLSHDIDHAYGALRQNARWLLRKGRLSTLMQMVFNHYLRTPDQLLLDKIMDIEDEHDMRSVFFWLVNSGKGTRKIHNADYNVDQKIVRRVQQKIVDRGWVNGLHKSAGRDTFPSELKRLGAAGSPVNRNHYLVTELPGTYDALEQAGIRLDATMGFPEEMGFRTGYGLPYQPYHLSARRPYAFLEVPLHIMDTTLRYYQQKDPQAAAENILTFLDNHKRNAVISILWHNNYFFEYAHTGWLEAYKSILRYLHDHQIPALLPDDLIARYS